MESRIWMIVCTTADGISKPLAGRWLVYSDAVASQKFLRRSMPGCTFELVEDLTCEPEEVSHSIA